MIEIERKVYNDLTEFIRALDNIENNIPYFEEENKHLKIKYVPNILADKYELEIHFIHED